QVFRRRDELVSRFQFVHDHRDAYEVKRLCQVLDVNRSSYYKWLDGADARAVRRREDQVLAEEIRRIHADSGGAYGSPRVTAELHETGTRVNHKRVARVMRTYSIVGIRLRRRIRTTVPDPAVTVVPDLFERDFTAPDPGRKYMGDITYLPLAGGEFLYLATVLDCFSRKVVGWSIADHMRTTLVADALRMAAATRGGLDGAVFHSDHGVQCASRAFAGLCSDLGVTRSMGAVGSSADNAACESFHASLKRETLQGARDYGDPATCRRTVFAWLTRYNTRRRHSANGHLSPNEYERRHHTAKLTLAA
uniref:IS3 family transposase n=1 Tax=Kitasatospora phosalacinea TaxID=2065 RepID=UPI001FD82A59